MPDFDFEEYKKEYDFKELKEKLDNYFTALSYPDFWEKYWPKIDADGKAVDTLLANGDEGYLILNNLLISAACSGSVEMTQTFVEGGAGKANNNEGLNIAIFYAAGRDRFEIVRYLLAQGAVLIADDPEEAEEELLIKIKDHYYIEFKKRLKPYRFDPNYTWSEIWPIIDPAGKAVSILLDKGDEGNQILNDLLIVAATAGEFEMTCTFVEAIAGRANNNEVLNTALYHTLDFGCYYDTARYLIDNGALIHASDHSHDEMDELILMVAESQSTDSVLIIKHLLAAVRGEAFQLILKKEPSKPALQSISILQKAFKEEGITNDEKITRLQKLEPYLEDPLVHEAIERLEGNWQAVILEMATVAIDHNNARVSGPTRFL